MEISEELVCKAEECIKKQDKAQAIAYYKQASELNSAIAMTKLARYYFFGKEESTPKDEGKFMELTDKALSMGCVDACFNKYLYYLRHKDLENQFYWIKRGARLGHPYCSTLMGKAYANGKYGLKQNMRNAIRWFRKAVALNDDTARMLLGNAYRTGSGVKRDIVKAVDLLTTVANNGNDYAMHLLAVIYKYGDGVIPADAELSHYWESKSGCEIDSIVWAFYTYFS
jgi:TPR repeat protein